MTAQAFEFDAPRGYRLAGRLELPDGQPQGWTILAHCFTCGKDSLASTRLARALAARGIGVLRFDFAGLGNSGGSFADATFAADVDDLVAAGNAMTRDGKSPSILVGHSLGGAAVLMAAGEMPGIRAVATLGAPFDTSHVLHQFDPQSLQTVETQGQAEVSLAGRPFVVRKSFIEDLARHDLASRIAQLQIPLLVLHSDGGYRECRANFYGCEAPQELHFARQRRPLADAPRRCRLCRRNDIDLGQPVSGFRTLSDSSSAKSESTRVPQSILHP